MRKEQRWWSRTVPGWWRHHHQHDAPSSPTPPPSAPSIASAPEADSALPDISFSFFGNESKTFRTSLNFEVASPPPAATDDVAVPQYAEVCKASKKTMRYSNCEDAPGYEPLKPPPLCCADCRGVATNVPCEVCHHQQPAERLEDAEGSREASPPAPSPESDPDYEHLDDDPPKTPEGEASESYEPLQFSSTPVSSVTLTEEDATADYEELEHCRGRLARRRRLRPGAAVERALRAMGGWWRSERVRMAEVVHRHARAQAVGAAIDDSDDKSVEVVVLRRPRPVEDKDGDKDEKAVRKSKYFPEGQSGFEELRRYIKQGGDFCKELSAILQERSEAETQYAKSLSKLSAKLAKASRDGVGTISIAWKQAGAQMEAQGEAHRALAVALNEEVVKPLRQLSEAQHRIRKSVETAVDKAGRGLQEWRTAESKSKKASFAAARENERLQDTAALEGQNRLHHHQHQLHQKSILSDKECAKLESKRRKAEEAVRKADVEYYSFCVRAERARLEWETAVTRGSHCLQALEEERLQQMGALAATHLAHLAQLGPQLLQSVARLTEPVEACDVTQDIQTVAALKGAGHPIPEQLLPDFYAEHVTLAMNRDRRRQALVKVLQLIRQDLERERRGKQGVENLAHALQHTPNFAAQDGQQNVSEKLHHMRSMLTYLEAARYKVQSALAEMEGQPRASHPLAAHIQVTRDRTGLQQSVLKVPPWVRDESLDQLSTTIDSPDWTPNDRGAGDGNSVQPGDSDFDEFSSQGSSGVDERDYQSSLVQSVSKPNGLTNGLSHELKRSVSAGGKCRALYDYSANLYDELNLSPGDVISIHSKQADGWWLGELNGIVGIFPATYVEEINEA